MIMLKTCEWRYPNNSLLARIPQAPETCSKLSYCLCTAEVGNLSRLGRGRTSCLSMVTSPGSLSARKPIVALRRSKGQPPTAMACCIRRVTAWRVELVAEPGEGGYDVSAENL